MLKRELASRIVREARRFAPEARAEFDAAAERYEEQRPDRGERFIAAVERAVRLIAAMPEVGPLHPWVPPELGVRQRVVRAFPFVVAYRVIEAVVRIDAVIHTSRRPGYWKRRIK